MRTKLRIAASVAVRIAIGLALLTVLVGRDAAAQNATTGAVQGVVTDGATGEALAGVTVVATSPNLQGTQAVITDDAGTYKITNLPPGNYLLTFYYADITVRRPNVEVSINKTSPAYVKVDTAQAGGEVITIEATAPVVDPTSTTQGVTMDQSYTRNIPLPGRTFDAALGAAAGAADDDMGTGFSGSTSLENQYIVDGVNTTQLRVGGVGSALLNDFIEEIEVVTGGYNAEYGRATGGVVNVVTKTGSNEFHGSVFGYATPGALVAGSEATPAQGSAIDSVYNSVYDLDFGFDLGGPILKDKVWFYVGAAPQLSRTKIDRITKTRVDRNDDGEPDEDPATGFLVTEELDRSTLTQNNSGYQLVSKLNFAPAPEHQGQLSVIGNPAFGRDLGTYGEPSATHLDYFALTTDVSAKWTSKFNDNKTEVEAVVGWHRASINQDALADDANGLPRQNLFQDSLGYWGVAGGESARTIQGCTDGGDGDMYPQIVNCPDEGVGYAIGGPGGIVNNVEQRYSARLSATQRAKLGGNHEIKAGVDVEDNRLDSLKEWSGGRYFNIFHEDQTTEIWRYVKVAPPGVSDGFDQMCADSDRGASFPCNYLGPSTVVGETLNWASYLRDSWQIMPNLTLNAGLRYEEQRMRYAKSQQGTVNPLTLEKLGTNAIVMQGMWAPRIGLLYDWTQEGRSKVYAHWGRFYESIPMELNNVNLGGETNYRQAYNNTTQCGDPVDGFNGANGPGCEAATGAPENGSNLYGTGILVAPGIKPQYMDESILGVEYELASDFKLGASFQYRELGRVVEDVSPDNTETYILANPGEWDKDEDAALQAQLDAATDPEEIERLNHLLTLYRTIDRFDAPVRNYYAGTLTATKRFGKTLLVQASYTYSRTKGNFPGMYSADNGISMPNISSQYDLIELLSNREGPLPQDRPHFFKVDGYYIFDLHAAGQIVTGGRVRALSGTPIDALSSNSVYGADEAFLLPRGVMGRSGFDAGLDLHLSYGRSFGKDMEFEVFGDFFNVFNRQSASSIDETYTYDNTNPIVGGEYEDVLWAKAQDSDGNEIADPAPPKRNRNFLNAESRYEPLTVRVGARFTF